MDKILDIRDLQITIALNHWMRDKKQSDLLNDILARVGDNKNKFTKEFSRLSKKQVDHLFETYIAYYNFHADDEIYINLNLRKSLEEKYFNVNEELKTKNMEYKIPGLLVKYRPGINPVRAMYFEVQELMTMEFNFENVVHQQIFSFFRDKIAYEKFINDINFDINQLTKLEKHYQYSRKLHSGFEYPMSYYHIQEMIKDMKKYLVIFERLNKKLNQKDDY